VSIALPTRSSLPHARRPLTALRATYRLQLHPGFGFAAASDQVPYLSALGISHCYCSPVFEASPHSRHGYDVVDPTQVRCALGGDPGRQTFRDTLDVHQMGWLADLVPNHMALLGNRWWDDVLRHGPASAFARFFDIADDDASNAFVVLPILASPYGVELLAGRLTLCRHGHGFAVRYGDLTVPVSDSSARRLGGEADPDAAVAATNADPWRLHELLEAQHYRLAWWRLARDEAPYRRFFDVNGLVGVRVEDPAVFAATHRLVATWLAGGDVEALRVDHLDGLADPAHYLERLRALAGATPIIVEKILADDEELPDWPVDGTTGYEFGAAVIRLMLPAGAEDAVTDFYRRFTGDTMSYDDHARRSRRDVLVHWLAGDTARVASLLYLRLQCDIRLRDYSLRDCTAVVRELIERLPRYRTYVRPGVVSREDAMVIDAVLGQVRQARPDIPTPVADAVAGVLRGATVTPTEAAFVQRFQQLATAVAAKAEEDTAFYRYTRFIALNEVGSRPDRFSESATEFHRRITRWQARHPRGLRATSTHDSKRGEDVRARLAVLPELWDDWAARVRTWSAWGDRLRVDGMPERGVEYYLYQTLCGAWPIARERVQEHLHKAVREAKSSTSWETPDCRYEDAIRHFVDGLFDDTAWLTDIASFVAALHPADWHKALSQVLIKLTVPGVPDVYQGSELWTLTLCDPDNRGDVDFGRRAALLDALDGLTAAQILARVDEGLPKLHVIARTLRLRGANPDLQPDSSYVPLAVAGARETHVIAYCRGTTVAVVAPLRTWQPSWAGTFVHLPAGTWRHVLSGVISPGGRRDLADLFDSYPVALLERIAA
jgi:(1->4)-alpha-D-glucan 1-alpha-D-glucosylmutase